MMVLKTPSGKLLQMGPKEPLRFRLRGEKIVTTDKELKRIYRIRN